MGKAGEGGSDNQGEGTETKQPGDMYRHRKIMPRSKKCEWDRGKEGLWDLEVLIPLFNLTKP